MDDTVDDHAPATYPESFWALVEGRADASPGHVLLSDDLGRSLTAAQLRDAALEVAGGLAERGIGEGSTVSWQLPTCIEALVLSMALCRLGAVQNPIIVMLREREVGSILDQVQPDLVVVPGMWRDFDHEAMFRSLLPPETEVLAVDHRAAAASGPHSYDLPNGDASRLRAATTPLAGETRWVFSTSGTTGSPKGVRHTDASVIAGSNGMIPRLAMGPDDVYPIAFPIPHIGGPVMLAMALRSGCRLVLLDAFDPATSPKVMAEAGATLLGSALPFHLAYVAAQERNETAPLYPRVKACTSGGAAKPPGHHLRIKAALGGAGVVSAWGLTEHPLATQASLDDTDEQLDGTEGRPAPGTEVRVVGSDERSCPPGEEGELRLKGAPMFLGYVDPALDAAAFDDDGWFRTGDLGVQWPSGHVAITGRLKDVIVRNAENISAKAVEDALRSHPSIVDVAVLGLPHDRTGEQVCAVLVLAPGHEEGDGPALGVTDLQGFWAQQGMARHTCPERVEVVGVIPRNAMGKVLTQDLRRSLLAT